ncbi:hypothetical protein EJ04DRAFT_582578 [Polyplosphaeria fusca]|uniref:Uncharacterized protein n=1 Tax=Polyplosphaeria fusca TaxID=682080 RepID=A0A9P4QKI3_9PLEO|nr:hypothetical protein EJ04DRAFT_582578 [Polyplosphaeria fusca]
MIIWMVPITSTLTPGKLSIRSELYNDTSLKSIPFINFTTLRFTDQIIDNGFGYTYSGPSQIAQSIAVAVSAGGAILPIRPPALNSSWNTEFYGPALNCTNSTQTRRQNLSESYLQWLRALQSEDACFGAWKPIYLGWFGDVPTPLINSSARAHGGDDEDTPYSTFILGGRDPIINVATYPGILEASRSGCVDSLDSVGSGSFRDTHVPSVAQDPLGTIGEGATMVRCQMFNSTYNV